jgi:hypothetical protein
MRYRGTPGTPGHAAGSRTARGVPSLPEVSQVLISPFGLNTNFLATPLSKSL